MATALLSARRLQCQVVEIRDVVSDAHRQNKEVLALATDLDLKRREAIEAIQAGDTATALRALAEQGEVVKRLIDTELQDVHNVEFRLPNLLDIVGRYLKGWFRDS